MFNINNIKQKLVVGLFLVIATIFLVDISLGFILEKYYKSAKSGIAYQENYIMRKSSQEVLFFGSSRAAFHYNSLIITDTLNRSVYNCGREGSGIYYHYGVLLSTIKRYSPKAIILDIDYRDIYKHEGIFGFDILKEHAPFYHRVSKEFDSLLVLKNSKEKIKLQSNLYRYNSKFFRIITGNVFNESGNALGFRKKSGIWKDKIIYFNEEKLIVDSNKTFTINKFISKAKENDIKVVLVVSPYFMLMPKDFLKPLEEIAQKENVLLLDHSADEYFINNRVLFNDKVHLNEKGANIYSSIVASELNKYLVNNID